MTPNKALQRTINSVVELTRGGVWRHTLAGSAPTDPTHLLTLTLGLAGLGMRRRLHWPSPPERLLAR